MDYNSYLMDESPLAKTLRSLSSYATLALIFLVIVAVCYIPFYLMFKKKGISLWRQICWLGFVFSAFLIIFATFIYIKSAKLDSFNAFYN